MTRSEAVWCAAYGAAYVAELARLCHGQERTTWRVVDGGVVSETETVDAREAAHRWATMAADAAAEGAC